MSSDYVPAALMQGALQLADIWGDLAAGMATVTRNPAAHVGMRDRGEIAIGKRADLVVFGRIDGAPMVHEVCAQGRRIS